MKFSLQNKLKNHGVYFLGFFDPYRFGRIILIWNEGYERRVTKSSG